MKMHKLRSSIAFLVMTLAALAASRPGFAQKYSITDLGEFQGGSDFAAAFALNANNQVVGDAASSGMALAFVWDPVFKMQNLGTLRGDQTSVARGINDVGVVVGMSQGSRRIDGVGFVRAFRTAPNRLIDPDKDVLPPLQGQNNSAAFGINADGLTAGISFIRLFGIPYPLGAKAVVWDQNGVPRDLGTFPGGEISEAFAINTNGAVVGAADLPREIVSLRLDAVIWDQNGRLQGLGALNGDDLSEALGINDKNEVVGLSTHGQVQIGGLPSPSADVTHAFLYDSLHGMVDLGNLGGAFTSSVAEGINNQTRIVGYSSTNTLSAILVQHAFVSQNNVMFDLNNLIPANTGWLLQNATAINAAGQIVGFGIHGGKTHAFLLTPPRKRVDIVESTRIVLSEPDYNSETGAFQQEVRFTNTGSDTIAGPFQLVLDSLPHHVTLLNATGRLEENRPYLTVDIPALAPGGSAAAQFEFRARNAGRIRYRLKLFSGQILAEKD